MKRVMFLLFGGTVLSGVAAFAAMDRGDAKAAVAQSTLVADATSQP